MTASVLVTRRLPLAVEERLRRDYAPRLNPDDRPYGADELIERSVDAAAILTCATDAWPAALIARLPDTVRSRPFRPATSTSTWRRRARAALRSPTRQTC